MYDSRMYRIPRKSWLWGNVDDLHFVSDMVLKLRELFQRYLV